MKPQITNASLEYKNNYPGSQDDSVAALGCEFDGARYHVWLDVETRELCHDLCGAPPVLYKNPPLNVEKGMPGHYWTRKLRADSAPSKAIIDAMFAAWDRENLKAKADQARADAIAAADRERQQRAAANSIDEAAPRLFAACQVIALTPHIRAYLEANDPKALEQLTKAIAAAQGGAA
jgi:hypothetical protein